MAMIPSTIQCILVVPAKTFNYHYAQIEKGLGFMKKKITVNYETKAIRADGYEDKIRTLRNEKYSCFFFF